MKPLGTGCEIVSANSNRLMPVSVSCCFLLIRASNHHLLFMVTTISQSHLSCGTEAMMVINTLMLLFQGVQSNGDTASEIISEKKLMMMIVSVNYFFLIWKILYHIFLNECFHLLCFYSYMNMYSTY